MPAASISTSPAATSPMMLEPRDPVLYFVQRLRDEAHRFAIGTHRAKRGKAIGANPARRDRRHRPGAQARAPQAFRLGQGGVARQHPGPAGGRRHQRADGADDLRLLPRAPRVAGSLPGTPSDTAAPRRHRAGRVRAAEAADRTATVAPLAASEIAAGAEPEEDTRATPRRRAAARLRLGRCRDVLAPAGAEPGAEPSRRSGRWPA